MYTKPKIDIVIPTAPGKGVPTSIKPQLEKVNIYFGDSRFWLSELYIIFPIRDWCFLVYKIYVSFCGGLIQALYLVSVVQLR